MPKIKIIKNDVELLIYFEEELLKKTSRTGFFSGLSDLYRATSREEALEIFGKIEVKAAKALVVRWLGSRALFSTEIRQKLRDKGFSDVTISEVLLFCERIGAIDDRNLAREKTERELRKGKGQLAALIKIRRWVDVETVSLDFSKIKELEKEALTKYLQKKRVDLPSLDFEERRKLYSALLRRGFKGENIQEILSF